MLTKPPFSQSSSRWVHEGQIVLTKGSQAIVLVSVYLLTNQPHIHPDLSLGTLTLYLFITSTLTTTALSSVGTSGHIGSMVVAMPWGRRSVLRGEWGESSLGVMVDLSC